MRALMKKPVAIMRQKAGLTQAELAKLVGSSRVYVGKFEIGTEKMSRVMAERISDQTGISAEWLLGEDTDNPITSTGKPFTKETFESRRLTLASPEDPTEDQVLGKIYQFIGSYKKAFQHLKAEGKLGLLNVDLKKRHKDFVLHCSNKWKCDAHSASDEFPDLMNRLKPLLLEESSPKKKRKG